MIIRYLDLRVFSEPKNRLGLGFGVWGSWFRVGGLGFRGLGFGVWGSWFRVGGLGFWGLGFRGLGFRGLGV